jgi:hypothetical protein
MWPTAFVAGFGAGAVALPSGTAGIPLVSIAY